MIYTVYSFNAEEVSKRLDRIAKKAEKYGVRFAYTVGEEHPVEVAVHEVDYINQVQFTSDTFKVAAVDFDIECDGLICSNGWQVLAKIEHGDDGNIVTPIGDSEIDVEWYSAPARCDHCGTNRVRAITFMVKNENGETRQVGRSCLKEYTGIDPATALMWAQVHDLFADDDINGIDAHGIRSSRVYDVADVLATACECIKRFGYRKADMVNSTRDMVVSAIGLNASAESIKKAKDIVNWLANEISETTVGIERDCVALARSGWAKERHFGRLCFMPVAYDREMERREREAKRNERNAREAEQSGYIGNVGDRITVRVAQMNVVTSWETQYGTTHLFKIVDENGNILMWKASTLLEIKGHYFESAENITIKCTVKEHSEYKGIKQTVVTRCKAI